MEANFVANPKALIANFSFLGTSHDLFIFSSHMQRIFWNKIVGQ